MIKQSFTVIPHDLIESGNLNLSLDTTSGQVDLVGLVVAGEGWFHKNLNINLGIPFKPAFFESKNLVNGLSVQINNAHVSIRDQKTALISYTQNEDNFLTGTAQLDLTGEFLRFGTIDLNGKLSGYTVHIELRPA